MLLTYKPEGESRFSSQNNFEGKHLKTGNFIETKIRVMKVWVTFDKVHHEQMAQSKQSDTYSVAYNYII